MSTGVGSHPQPAGERAYRWVKQRVLDGTLAGGSLISEGDVARDVEVSRTPVREAFLRLQVEGLLRLYPKRGALVVPVSAVELAEVTEARILLETFAVDKVIAAGRHREVAEAMRSVLAEQRRVAMPAGAAEFATVDRRFHETLVAAAGNSLVGQFYAGLGDRQLRMFTSALQRVPTRHAEILDEHGQLCELLALADGTALRALLESHISGTHGALR